MQTLPLVHMSPETAYYIDDYPYGFNLRCVKRVWLEYRPKFGFRVMEQTSNPRKPNLVWNKPKAGNYWSVCVLYLDNQQHVQVNGIHIYKSPQEIRQFAAQHGHVFVEGTIAHKTLHAILKAADAYEAKKAAREAVDSVMYNIHSDPPVRIV